MTLPPYNPDATCPKCGGGQAAVKFRANIEDKVAEYERVKAAHDEEVRRSSRWWNVAAEASAFKSLWLAQAESYLASRPPPYTEHIRRTCTRCGYAWPEAPTDKESA